MPGWTGEKSLQKTKLLPGLKTQHTRPDKHKSKQITGANRESGAVLSSDLYTWLSLTRQTFKFLGHTSTKTDIYFTVCSTTYAQDYSTYKIEINYISLKVNAGSCLEYSLFYMNRCQVLALPTKLPTLK